MSAMMSPPARWLGFAAAVATLVVGVVHAINSFKGSAAGLRWSSGFDIDETNNSFAEAFLLTPYQVKRRTASPAHAFGSSFPALPG
jgi:hypothetical protein